jgi:hypothetical protein
MSQTLSWITRKQLSPKPVRTWKPIAVVAEPGMAAGLTTIADVKKGTIHNAHAHVAAGIGVLIARTKARSSRQALRLPW